MVYKPTYTWPHAVTMVLFVCGFQFVGYVHEILRREAITDYRPTYFRCHLIPTWMINLKFLDGGMNPKKRSRACYGVPGLLFFWLNPEQFSFVKPCRVFILR